MLGSKKTFCNFSLRVDQKEKLQKIAEEDHRALSSLMQKIIDEYLEKLLTNKKSDVK